MKSNLRKINMIKPTCLKEYRIKNFKKRDDWALVVPLLGIMNLTTENISEIVRICNQEGVYNLLFREKLNGERYKEINAQSFANDASKGWNEGTRFVFLIKSKDNAVIGAINIQSNNPDFSEIGYWADENNPGYMTNAVVGIIDKAKNAGYRSLVAYTKLENDKSKGVLSRAGFEYVGKEERRPGAIRDKFVFKID